MILTYSYWEVPILTSSVRFNASKHALDTLNYNLLYLVICPVGQVLQVLDLFGQ